MDAVARRFTLMTINNRGVKKKGTKLSAPISIHRRASARSFRPVLWPDASD
jgi:hypothetical protein